MCSDSCCLRQGKGSCATQQWKCIFDLLVENSSLELVGAPRTVLCSFGTNMSKNFCAPKIGFCWLHTTNWTFGRSHWQALFHDFLEKAISQARWRGRDGTQMFGRAVNSTHPWLFGYSKGKMMINHQFFGGIFSDKPMLVNTPDWVGSSTLRCLYVVRRIMFHRWRFRFCKMCWFFLWKTWKPSKKQEYCFWCLLDRCVVPCIFAIVGFDSHFITFCQHFLYWNRSFT